MRLIFGTCPNCGADVPTTAKVCPECGSCEQTGWSDDAIADGLGLPNEDFDYRGFLQREFSEHRVVPRGLNWVWWLTGIVLLLLAVAFFVVHFFSILQTHAVPEKPPPRKVLPQRTLGARVWLHPMPADVSLPPFP